MTLISLAIIFIAGASCGAVWTWCIYENWVIGRRVARASRPCLLMLIPGAELNATLNTQHSTLKSEGRN